MADQSAPEAPPAGSTPPKGGIVDWLLHTIQGVTTLVVAVTGLIVAAGALFAALGGNHSDTPTELASAATTELSDATDAPSTQTAPGTPTPDPFDELDEWRAEADSLCRDAGNVLGQLIVAMQNAQIDYATGADSTADVLFGLSVQLVDVDPPPAYSRDVERLLVRLEESGQAMRDAAGAFRMRDGTAVESAADRYDQAVDRFVELARSLGARDCAAIGTG